MDVPEKRAYQIIRQIGQGTFGRVYEALDHLQRRVAIKRVEKLSNFVSREVEILQLISHDNCIKLLDVFLSCPDGSDRKWQNIVLEFCPYTLASYMKTQSPSHKMTKHLFYQLCMGLHHLHSKNISHRDLTPNNILINAKNRLKIADFGSAKTLDDNHVSMSYICSRYYRAPELLMGCSTYTTKIDVWSAGCIFGEMLLGKPIFPGADTQDQFVKIVLILGSPSLSDLWAMRKNYDQNITFPKIEPLYFGDILPSTTADLELACDLLSSMLCYNPKARISIEEALKHPYFDDLQPHSAAKVDDQCTDMAKAVERMTYELARV